MIAALNEHTARYLIRLDDFCETSNPLKWEKFFGLLDRYHIKPIVAVIPRNRDNKLTRCGPFNKHFWQQVRQLQDKRYAIALHGYDHVYCSAHPGIFKQNNRAEFAGLPLEIQEEKIRKAWKIFVDEGINSNIFVAPAHSLDRNTLLALHRNTSIRCISDGLLFYPYERLDFKWIPVQLPEAEVQRNGVWTFCYHPETTSERQMVDLEVFLSQHATSFLSFGEIDFQQYSLLDLLHEKYLITRRQLITKIRYVRNAVLQS